MNRGRLSRYALYQMRDYVMERGFPALLIGVLVGWTTLLELRAQYGMRWLERPEAMALSEMFLQRAVFGQFAFLGILISVSGIVANDRRHGFFRLLFAKPVSAVRFYLQSFVVAGLGMLTISAGLLLLWGYVALPVAPWGTMRALAFYYLLVGATAFLMSSLVRWDWVATGVVWGGSIYFSRMLLASLFKRTSSARDASSTASKRPVSAAS